MGSRTFPEILKFFRQNFPGFSAVFWKKFLKLQVQKRPSRSGGLGIGKKTMAIYGPNIHEKAVETAHTMLLGPKIAQNGYFWAILAEKPLKNFF